MLLPPPHQSTSSTLVDVSTVASLKAPYGPLTFPAVLTAAPVASSSSAFNTPPTFVSRTAETFFRLPAPPFSFMQAGTPSSQVLPGAAQAPGNAFHSTLSSAVFAPLSLESTIVFCHCALQLSHHRRDYCPRPLDLEPQPSWTKPHATQRPLGSTPTRSPLGRTPRKLQAFPRGMTYATSLSTKVPLSRSTQPQVLRNQLFSSLTTS